MTLPLSKRLLDILLSIVLIVLLLPLYVLLALIIRLYLGTPVIFKQERPGLGKRPFTLYKFRSMIDVYDHNGEILPDKDRLTALGRLLRTTSLDELPELINVLKGDMSLVGPRPLLMRYLPYFTTEEQIRHTVRPGITGWAQVNGRNYAPWDDRLKMDVWYVTNWSLRLDLKILLMTIMQVVLRKSVAADTDEVETDLDCERSEKLAY